MSQITVPQHGAPRCHYRLPFRPPARARPRARAGCQLPAGLLTALLLVSTTAAAQQVSFDCQTQTVRVPATGAALVRSPTAVVTVPLDKQQQGYVRVGGGCEVSRFGADSAHAAVMVKSVPDGETGWRCQGADPAFIPNPGWAQASVTFCRARHETIPSLRLQCQTLSQTTGPALYPSALVQLTPALVSSGFVVVSGGCASAGVTHSEPVVRSLRGTEGKGWFCQAADPPNIAQQATLTASLVACRVTMDAAGEAQFIEKPVLECAVTPGTKVSGLYPKSFAQPPAYSPAVGVPLGGGCDLTYFGHGSNHAEFMVKSGPQGSSWACLGADPPNIPNPAAATASVVTCKVKQGKVNPATVAKASALNNGSLAEASAYYKELAGTLGFLKPETIESQATLGNLLEYLGYKGLTALDVEFVKPEDLMTLPQLLAAGKAPPMTNPAAISKLFAANLALPKEVQVSRFFAPKIVNFAVQPAARQLGWRRLVRLNTRAGSAAKAHFVDSAWILFNHFTQAPHSPFGGSLTNQKNGSVNTQVALLTGCTDTSASSPCKDLNSIYWVDFGPSSAGSKLSYQLNAFFDAGSLRADAPYFVPNGCDTCHGSLRGKAVLNLLDTDHWMDRITDGDFPALTAPGAPAVLFDAGSNTTTPQYSAAFDVMRTLNQEIEVMQTRVHKSSFHLAATRKWLELHKNSVQPQKDLIARAFDFFNTGHPLKKTRKPTPAPLRWTATPADRELLGLLNKYCYRCHGAIRYDVFSKDLVADQTSPMIDRIDPNPTQKAIIGFPMPPDRSMDAADKKRMLDLLDQLDQQTH